MNRINPDEFIREIDKSLDLIENDLSKTGTISNIIDRGNRSMLLILRSIMEISTERVVTEETRDLKEKVLRLQVEVARLCREKRLGGK